jgi:uncharacterized protein YcbX
MLHVGTIKSIYRYPVKSMAGEQLASAQVGWHGIDGDRRFAFVRAGNMSGFPWLTASKMPELIRYRAHHLESNEDALPTVRVETPDGNDVGVESESLRQLVASTYGTEVTLIGVRNGIFDDAPISLISTTTIGKLESDSGCVLDPRRFRPNILVEPAGPTGLDESLWTGKTLVFGDHPHSPAVRVTARDVRCVMVNLDPETAVADARVLKSIVRSQDKCAGVYATVFAIGTVSAGDKLYLKD